MAQFGESLHGRGPRCLVMGDALLVVRKERFAAEQQGNDDVMVWMPCLRGICV